MRRCRRLGKKRLGKGQWAELFDAWRARLCGVKGGKPLPLIADGETPIEPVMEVDGGVGIAATVSERWQLQSVTGQRDGVVVGNSALVTEGKEERQLAVVGQRPEGRTRLGGGHCHGGAGELQAFFAFRHGRVRNGPREG